MHVQARMWLHADVSVFPCALPASAVCLAWPRGAVRCVQVVSASRFLREDETTDVFVCNYQFNKDYLVRRGVAWQGS